MKYWDLLKRTEHFVRTFVQEHRNVNIIYHGLIHTENVVNAAIKMSDHYNLSEAERFICIAAAWFHDIGYYEDKLRH